jgi:tRNA modification GTPase
MFSSTQSTIIAVATPLGIGAIAMIRISGKDAFSITQKIWKSKKNLLTQAPNTLLVGTIIDQENIPVDEVVISIFHAPHSFTGDNTIEISCHASPYIVQKILTLLVENGAKLAQAGEFTRRAYLNGRVDLAQAEAIADVIASENENAHKIAFQQMRGSFSKQIKKMREDFIKLAGLLELELDFAEEDVEFANRGEIQKQIHQLTQNISDLANSYQLGKVLKNGFPVAIVGKPNAGKSTLLNALLAEDKAIVSPIAGTTRDSIEDETTIKGIKFRFVDTAGLRQTDDIVENIGIARTKEKMQVSALILYLFDVAEFTPDSLLESLLEIEQYNIPILLVANKIDIADKNSIQYFENFEEKHQKPIIFLSAYTQHNLENLQNKLSDYVQMQPLHQNQTIITNTRHFACLQDTLKALEHVKKALDQKFSTEMVATDMREVIYQLGTITGEITNNDLLEFIFTKFCIGK